MGKLGGSLASLAVVVPLIAVAGCGQPSRGPVLDSSVAAAPSQSLSPSAASTAECATATLTITNADNGKTVCVRPCTQIRVELTNTTQPLQHTGNLEPRSPNEFTALSKGQGTISTVISPCTSPSGTAHCLVLELFKVQVEISAAS